MTRKLLSCVILIHAQLICLKPAKFLDDKLWGGAFSVMIRIFQISAMEDWYRFLFTKVLQVTGREDWCSHLLNCKMYLSLTSDHLTHESLSAIHWNYDGINNLLRDELLSGLHKQNLNL